MSRIFELLIGTSWRTTLTGYLGAIALGVLPVIETGTFELRDLVLPAVVALLSRVAKDAGVTGPATQQDKKE